MVKDEGWTGQGIDQGGTRLPRRGYGDWRTRNADKGGARAREPCHRIQYRRLMGGRLVSLGSAREGVIGRRRWGGREIVWWICASVMGDRWHATHAIVWATCASLPSVASVVREARDRVVGKRGIGWYRSVASVVREARDRVVSDGEGLPLLLCAPYGARCTTSHTS